MTLSLSKHPVDYTVNSEQLSLPEFVSAYGKRFPHAAIVTQGYCPVEGEEDSEEFSSGEEGASPATGRLWLPAEGVVAIACEE